MFGINTTPIVVTRDVSVIIIPDGVESELKKGADVFIQQVLGGMFTVQTNEGYLVRIDGKDADAICQPIPDDRRDVSEEEVSKKGLSACVMDQLKTCYDPEIPVNIVDLGLIYECEVANEKDASGAQPVRIEMTLTAPGCGMGEILKSDVEKKINDIPGVSSVLVDLVFDPPWDSSLMSEAAKLQLGFL